MYKIINIRNQSVQNYKYKEPECTKFHRVVSKISFFESIPVVWRNGYIKYAYTETYETEKQKYFTFKHLCTLDGSFTRCLKFSAVNWHRCCGPSDFKIITSLSWVIILFNSFLGHHCTTLYIQKLTMPFF